MKSNELIYLAAAAAAFLVWKSPDSGQSTLQKMQAAAAEKATNEKHPAFTYPPNQTMDDQTEDKLVSALLAHRDVNKQNATMNDGSKLTEAVYQQLLADFNAAIAYYPDRPQKNLEKLRDNLVQYKDQLVAAPEGVGMGPISGFSGVY
jgi:hypothetical protein